jgi:hypothetical protein
MTMADEHRRSARGFLTRLPDLDVVGRRILDVRRHRDDLSLLLAERGAREVVSVAALAAEWPQEAPYDLVISRGGLGGATGADAHVGRLRAVLDPEGTIVIAFSPRRRIAPRAGDHRLTLGVFADVMARSRLHCTGYRVHRVSARAPILRTTVISLWRQPLYDR